MKFIRSFVFAVFAIFVSCSDCIQKKYPRTELIYRFSKKLCDQTGCTLSRLSSGPKQTEEEIKRCGKELYIVSYYFKKDKNDCVSLDEARCLFVSVIESFLKEVNADESVREDLNEYPMTAEWLHMTVDFMDKDQQDLRQGIYFCALRQGEIKYGSCAYFEGASPAPWNKSEYVYKESYQSAYQTVKAQNCLKDYYSAH